MGKFFKDPLLHFLLLGTFIFVANGLLNQQNPTADPRTIVVNRGDLLTFMQYRSKAFNEKRFGIILDAMPAKASTA